MQQWFSSDENVSLKSCEHPIDRSIKQEWYKWVTYGPYRLDFYISYEILREKSYAKNKCKDMQIIAEVSNDTLLPMSKQIMETKNRLPAAE